MPKYRVEVAYRTKRGGVCLGRQVEAPDEEAAIQIAEDATLKGYPGRKWAYTRCTEVGFSPPTPEAERRDAVGQ